MAIALFPLLDNETIGSNLARYGEFLGLETTLPLRQRIFGYGCRPDTRLPSGLRLLVEQARDYWSVSIDEVVKNHTEFFYATLTLDETQREEMRSHMLDQPDGRCFRRRVCGWTGERATRFRYCDACLLEWSGNGVPAHWLVDHQLPGAYYCCRHSHMLRRATSVASEGFTDPTVLAIRSAFDEPVLTKSSVVQRHAIEDIARRSAQCRAAVNGLPSTLAYRELLRDARMIWPNGRLDERAFIAAVLGYLGREYCQTVGMTWQKVTNWLRHVAREKKNYEHAHPLMFIAAESLLCSRCESPGSFLPGGQAAGEPGFASGTGAESLSGGMPGEMTCTGILHRRSDTWQVRREEGAGRLVVCSCGVSYRGPDVGLNGRTKLTATAYGDRYRCLILADGSGGSGSEARSSKSNPYTEKFKRWARCAGFVRERKFSAEEIARLRSQWRTLVEQAQPEKRITSAYRADSVLYRTLRRCDREWFVAFNLSNRTRLRRSSCVMKRGRKT